MALYFLKLQTTKGKTMMDTDIVVQELTSKVERGMSLESFFQEYIICAGLFLLTPLAFESDVCLLCQAFTGASLRRRSAPCSARGRRL